MDIKKSQIQELFWYGVFGVLTTVLNIFLFWLLCTICGIHYMVSNVIAWIVCVAFAFVTNKLFVFKSKSWQQNLWIKECAEFVESRLFTGVIECVGLFIAVSLLKFDKDISKVVITVIVIILNYVLSKCIVFKKK